MQNFVKENTGQDFTEPQTALYMKGKLKKKNKSQVNVSSHDVTHWL